MDYKEINLESYDTNASVFADYFKGLLDLERRPEFKQFVNLLKGNKILDLGCGGGDHALWFKKQSLDVTAIDFSEEMVKICNRKGLKAIVMDIEDLKFNNNSFEGIWAVTSLLHIPKLKIRQVIAKLADISVSDGLIYVVLKEGEGEEFLVDKQNTQTKRFFSFWQKDEFLRETKDFFTLINFERNQVGQTNYLHFFFRKR